MKIRDGWYWPDNDIHSYDAIFKELFKVELMDKYVKEKNVVIQAGGNCGVFAKEFAKTWGAVYTFEPNAENFNCLAGNCPDSNIIKFQAALGSNHKMVEVDQSADHLPNNCGAYQVIGEGITPTMMIDDLELKECDLIFLDIEGYEIFALQGGYETIKEFHPVIVIENKDLPLMYGVAKEQVTDFLIEEFGYEVKERVQRDVILA